jgi:prepilin-type processing-associated H-X9-DG protein
MIDLVMYDSAFNNQFPHDGDAYAGYVDGHVGDQPNYSWIVANFPGKLHMSITVFGNDADCLDIESGAASVSGAARWYLQRKAAGVARPVFYASASLMNSDLIPAIKAAGLPRSGYRLWSAHYRHGQHICGPSSCGLLSVPADGTQWDDHTGSLNADRSLLDPFFFSGIIPPALYLTQTETDAIVSQLPILIQGMSDDRLPHWYVRRAQALLNAIYGSTLTLDGIYGPATAAAITGLQKQYGLTRDGICGKDTWTRLVAG